MAIEFYSPMRSREKILVFGGAGAGKSHAACTIANGVVTNKVHVVEFGDVSYDRLLETQWKELGDRGTVEVVTTWEWEEVIEEVSRIVGVMDRDDWLVVDLFGDTWQACQDWFTRSVFDVESAEYFLQVRKEMEGGKANLSAFDGWVDWSVINAQYGRLKKLVLRARGHVLCTAGVDKVQTGDAGREDRAIFGGSLKPRGQKAIAHWFNSVVRLERKQGNWVGTSVKDRGRETGNEAWNMQEWGDMMKDYLVRVQGWKPRKVGE